MRHHVGVLNNNNTPFDYLQTHLLGRPDPDAKREQGYVCFIKENFGFVRCVDRTGDLFFHLTEAPQDINIGDEVDFVVGTGGRYLLMAFS